MAVIYDKFESQKILFQAITDVDKAISANNEDVLDEVLNAVTEINKKDYPEEYKQNIINNIRLSLITLYENQQNKMNQVIGLATSYQDTEDRLPLDQLDDQNPVQAMLAQPEVPREKEVDVDEIPEVSYNESFIAQNNGFENNKKDKKRRFG